jgi:hypothetical protein
MDRSRPAAERVRPILEAMERSIDAARRRRTQPGTTPATPRPASMADRQSPPNHAQPMRRLKARPKRVPAFDASYRSQAG